MNKKVVGGLLAVLFITQMGQTFALLKLQKVANAPRTPTTELMNNSNNNQAAAAASRQIVTDKTLEQYMKDKYPRDYQKRLGRIESKINTLLAVNKITNENPEELRRFLCWITGGTWVQIGPSKVCLYPENKQNMSTNSNGSTSWIEKAIVGDKQMNDDYYKSKKISETDVSSEIQKILTSEGVNPEIQAISLRRFFCRLFGGTWSELDPLGITIEAGPDGVDYTIWSNPFGNMIIVGGHACTY
jgi:hypothetical protein